MNPTAALIGATMKYMVTSHEADRKSKEHGRKKPGFLFAEKEIVEVVRKALGVDTSRHPLVYLVEAADDCVYSICDVEDGVRKGILSFDAAVRGLMEKAKSSGGDDNAISSIAAQAKESIDEGVESGPKLSGHARDDSYMQMFRVMVIGKTVEGSANAFLQRYDDIMAGTYNDELVADDEAGVARSLVKACKKLGVAKIYNTRPTIELELRGGKIIQSLLDTLWLGIDPNTKEEDDGKRCHSLISHSYRHLHDFELEHAKTKARHGYSTEQIERYYGLLLLTDYVGGMTDSFASDLYTSLNHG